MSESVRRERMQLMRAKIGTRFPIARLCLSLLAAIGWATTSTSVFAQVSYTVKNVNLSSGQTVQLSDLLSFSPSSDVDYAFVYFFEASAGLVVNGGYLSGYYDPPSNHSGTAHNFDIVGSYAPYNSQHLDFPSYNTGSITLPATSGKASVQFQIDYISGSDKSISGIIYPNYLNLQVGPSLSFKDIATNRVTATASAVGDMVARFLPSQSVSLAAAAKLASDYTGQIVDHFNWIQEISRIYVPGYGEITPEKTSLAAEFWVGRGTGVDPSLGGNLFNRIKNGGLPTSDNLPFYFDENAPLNPAYKKQYLISANTSDTQLDFFDSPGQIIKGTQIDFTTYLVGVTGSDQAVYLDGVDGLGFNWRYTQGAEQSAECIASPSNCKDLEFAGTGSGEGATELLNYLTAADYHAAIPRLESYASEVSGAPEPGSWVLLIIGVGLVGSITRRRRPTSASLAPRIGLRVTERAHAPVGVSISPRYVGAEDVQPLS